MKNQQKRVAAIHDLSGYGRCSLTVALPVLSCTGHEVCALPTAVLSSHTGGLPDVAVRDLTADMPGFVRQWKGLGLQFDAIYTGFLGSAAQIGVVEDFLQTFRRPETLVLVDPAMADHGKLYSTYTSQMAEGARRLCAGADLIVPNTTEAALLLGETWRGGPYTRAWVEKILHRLAALGPRMVVLTGVWFAPPLLGAASLDGATGEISYAFASKTPGSYPGTGDLLASALLGALLDGRTLKSALQVAVDFTATAIRRTYEAGTDPRGGVQFERCLPQLVHELGLT